MSDERFAGRTVIVTGAGGEAIVNGALLPRDGGWHVA